MTHKKLKAIRDTTVNRGRKNHSLRDVWGWYPTSPVVGYPSSLFRDTKNEAGVAV